MKACDAGYNYIEAAIVEFERVSLTPEENVLVRYLSEQKHLGQGEMECIAVCKARKFIILTNDAKAKQEAQKQGIAIYDLKTILWKLKKMTAPEELKQIIFDIETKDHTTLLGKEDLLRE